MNDISSDDIFLLKQRLAEQEALIHALQEKLSNREREIDHLQAQLDKLRRMNFGSRSEKVSRRIAQMEADLNRLQKESDTLTGRVYDPAVQRPLRQTRTRKPFPESLPRDEKRLLPAAPCCPNCGGSLSYLGEDTADITRQEFRLLQAELREYGFRTEIAGYDALRLHTESRMLFADADSLRISPREARSLIEQAEKRQKDAQNADKKAADMLAEYERRKGILDTRLSELEKNGGAALAVLDAQQARLLGQQTRNDRAISEARNKLSSVTESLNTARNALTRAEQQLTQQKNTPDGKTIVSPEKFPGRSSTNHSIVVSGDPRFAGTIKITTSAVIDNRANLNYLLTHSGLDYKRNILNDRNPVVTEDVEGDKKIYNAEVAEWDKLRQRLFDARNKITSAESAVNSARNNLSARTNEQKHANDALNALLKEKENIRNQLAGINQKIAEEKRKQDELKATKDAINFTTEFLKSVSEKYGAKAEQLAREMAGQAKGKKIRNVEEALKTYEKYRADINKKINAKDRAAIAAALESVKLSDISSNLNRFSRGLGYAGKFTSLADWITEFGKAVRTENWRPLFVKTEAIIAGNAATALVALVFSILTGSALGIIGYGLLMAVTGALIDESLVEKANKFWGI